MYQKNQIESFGSMQETFRYRLKSFVSGDQFTIVEDMPKNKPIRFEQEKRRGKDGGEFDSKTYLIRVISRGIEADLEVYPKDLPRLAILCPKGLENFRGCTFVSDGYNWAFMGIDNPQTPISNLSQAMRDPRQPDLNPPPQPIDQRDIFTAKLVNSIKTLTALGNDVDVKYAMKICENITPGKAMDLLQYAKTKGAVIESEGKYLAP